MTDENKTEDQIMTDNFLRMFSSGKMVTEFSAIPEDCGYFLTDKVLVSCKIYHRYHLWLETLPSLLKELI
jgi:hypothetical protein